MKIISIVCFSLLLCGGFDFKAHAQNTWPGSFTFSDENEASRGIVILSDQSMVTTSIQTDIKNIKLSKIRPNGIVSHSFRFDNSVIYFGNTNIIYDSTHQRIFVYNFSSEFISILPINISDSTAYRNINFLGKSVIICFDTALNQLWSKTLVPVIDSTSQFTHVALDGTGGVYVASRRVGSYKQAYKKFTDNPTGSRYRFTGYNQLTRIGKNGSIKWNITQKDPGIDSARRSTGVSFLVPRSGYQIDMISEYADTTIGANQTLPETIMLNLSRIDTNGIVRLQKIGILKSSAWYTERIGKLNFKSDFINGDQQFFYYGLDQKDLRIVLFKMDSSYQFVKIIKLKSFDIFGDILIAGPDRVVLESTNFGGAPGYEIFSFDKNSLQVQEYFLGPPLCLGGNKTFPHFSSLKSISNGQISNDFVYTLYSFSDQFTSYKSNPLLKFRNVTETPCRFFEKKPIPAITDVTNQMSIEWKAGSHPLIRTGIRNWKDTIHPIQNDIKRTIVSICETQKLFGKDKNVVVCGDSLIVPLPENFDIRKVNGITFTAKAFIIRSQGQYIFEIRDTCRISANWLDTINVRFEQPTFVNLQPDRINLCQGDSERIQIASAPGVQYKWTPSAGLKDSSMATQTFSSRQIPLGLTTYYLTASRNNVCKSKDSIQINNSPSTLATIEAEEPDNLLRLKPATFRNYNWTVNGGNLIGPRNVDSVAINWAAYFQGQQAEVNYKNESGCSGTAVYVRPKPIEPPAADTTFLPLEFPNLITPNKDNKNDYFEILNTQANDIIEINIFNRWGKQVYANKRYKNEFPAENKLENGTYFYIARAVILRRNKLEEKEYRGWLVVMKD